MLVLTIPFSSAAQVPIEKLFQVEETVEEKTTSSTTTYFYAGSKLIATKNQELKYHYQDRLGSDINSKTLPFGQEIESQERFSFTGKELDQDLYYFTARYYDPNIGRFTSTDPFTGQGGNLAYAYVANNPIMRVDPTGTVWNEEVGELYVSLPDEESKQAFVDAHKETAMFFLGFNDIVDIGLTYKDWKDGEASGWWVVAAAVPIVSVSAPRRIASGVAEVIRKTEKVVDGTRVTETKRIVTRSRVGEHSVFKKAADKIAKHPEHQERVNKLVEAIVKGEDLGDYRIKKLNTADVYEIGYNARGGGPRVFFRRVQGEEGVQVTEIVAKSLKGDEQKVIKALKRFYPD